MKDNQSYYDDFSKTYDQARSYGYHAYIDDFEADCVQRFHRGQRVLEIGCGTGQILRRISINGSHSEYGIDLSFGMLEHSRNRGLLVYQASATSLPFRDESFDLVYSFKVLPHIEDLDVALSEISRVLSPGGRALLEFYNPNSLRGLWKKIRWYNVRVGKGSHDRQVFTAYHTPQEVVQKLPSSLTPIGAFGVVVLTPHAAFHRVPVLGAGLRSLERLAGRSSMARWGGFYIQAVEKSGTD